MNMSTKVTQLIESVNTVSENSVRLKTEMKDHFGVRTNLHINLFNKYLNKIVELNLPEVNNEELLQDSHDKSKWSEPEYTPYLHISWKYKSQGEGKIYEPPQEIKDDMNAATYHHIKNNRHHPEYWDPSTTLQPSLNQTNRDAKPEKLVDATKMPLTHVAGMVADWLAMSEEKNTKVKDWVDKNVNIRWKFTIPQVDLINNIISLIPIGGIT